MKRFIPLLMLALLACQQSAAVPTPTALPPTTAVSPSTTVSPTNTFTPSPTPELYEEYTIDYLRSRTYGGGAIEVTETREETDSFTRYLIRYPSDGLNIHGFVNVPKGDGPFPVIIAVHGFVDVATYQTLDYTTPAIDVLTQAGYIVFHPNLRGYPPSDNGDNLFRVGMAVDVLNLIALVKAESGPSEIFATSAPESTGLWGHSMGGNIALRVLTVSSDVKATVLYAPMSGDEIKNAELLSSSSSDTVFQTELSVSPMIVERISPIYYYSDIGSPVQLHHGTADRAVPVAWAEETCSAATKAGMEIECIYYPDEGHTFRARVMDQFVEAVLGFYKMHFSP
jgi:uncharacterized protein